jgi:hypothetical protein
MWSLKYLLGCAGTAFVLVALAHPAIADDKPAKPRKAETPEQAIEFLAAASKAGGLEAALNQIAHPFHDVMLWYILSEEADDVLRTSLDQKFGKEERKGSSTGVKMDLLRIQKIEILAKDKGNNTRVNLRVRETVKSFQGEGNEIAETTYLALNDGEGWKLLRPFTVLTFGDLKDDISEESSSKKGPDGKEIGVFKFTFKKDLDVLGQKMREVVEKREGKKLPELLDQAKNEKAAAEKVAADVKGGTYKTRKKANDAYEEAIRQVDKKKP